LNGIHAQWDWILRFWSDISYVPQLKRFLIAFNNQDQPRNGNRTQRSGIAKLQRSIAILKAEINPAVKFYKPSANPKPCTAAQDSLWLSRKIEIVKNSGENVTSGNVVSAIGNAKIDFYVDSLAVWNIGGTSLTFTSGTGALVQGVSVVKTDWGTPDAPPAIGFNVPKALAKQFAGVTSTSTDTLCTSTIVGTAVTTGNSFVHHLWVVYRPSA